MEAIINSIDYDYINVKQKIFLLFKRYPFLKSSSIGKSCVGREIPLIKIGNGKDRVLYAAAFHGSERITCNLLLKFIEELCEALVQNSDFCGINVRSAMENRELLILPLINPDGCEISLHGEMGCGYLKEHIRSLCGGSYTKWNANARGVDINHNFNAGWRELKKKEVELGILGPASTRFGGFSPESEPETIALCSLCRSTEIRHAVAFHSQGEVIYWSFGDKMPKRSKKMAQIMAASSGYALDVPSPIATGGGFKDWFIKEFERPAFTVEIGLGENPLPISDLDEIYKRTKEMLILCAIM